VLVCAAAGMEWGQRHVGSLRRRQLISSIVRGARLHGLRIARARRAVWLYDPFRKKIPNCLAGLRLVRREDAVKAPIFADDDDDVLIGV